MKNRNFWAIFGLAATFWVAPKAGAQTRNEAAESAQLRDILNRKVLESSSTIATNDLFKALRDSLDLARAQRDTAINLRLRLEVQQKHLAKGSPDATVVAQRLKDAQKGYTAAAEHLGALVRDSSAKVRQLAQQIADCADSIKKAQAVKPKAPQASAVATAKASASSPPKSIVTKKPQEEFARPTATATASAGAEAFAQAKARVDTVYEKLDPALVALIGKLADAMIASMRDRSESDSYRSRWQQDYPPPNYQAPKVEKKGNIITRHPVASGVTAGLVVIGVFVIHNNPQWFRDQVHVNNCQIVGSGHC